jgi:pimeloyl-ACP methyl ester carboxylesterase
MVGGVVLLDPILISRNAPFDAMSYSDAHPWVTMVHQALTAGEARADTARRLQALYPEVPAEDALEWARRIRTMDPLAIEYVMADRLLDGFDLEDALRNIRCPALLLGGQVALGSLVRDTDLEFFKSLVENAAVSRVVGAGHGLLDEGSVAKVLDHTEEFLRRNDAEPGR